jgi:cold shock CspA family protein
MNGTVVSDSTKGFVFIEDDETHQSIFCHISQVKDERCLHVGDRVSFTLIPHSRKQGMTMAGNVVYLGRVIVRQVGGKAVQS